MRRFWRRIGGFEDGGRLTGDGGTADRERGAGWLVGWLCELAGVIVPGLITVERSRESEAPSHMTGRGRFF